MRFSLFINLNRRVYFVISENICIFAITIKTVCIMSKYLDPKADLTFKKVFGEHPNLVLSLLNALLPLPDGMEIKTVSYLTPENIPENPGKGTFYAIHKTKDGQMAPLARGIYMPLTDTPTIGNYNNPTQMASGIYYQEGIKYLAPELVQKVEFKIGL